MMETTGRGVLDPPHARGMTSVGCSALSSVIARSEATKQSILSLCRAMDCFASLAMTAAGPYSLKPPHPRQHAPPEQRRVRWRREVGGPAGDFFQRVGVHHDA